MKKNIIKKSAVVFAIIFIFSSIIIFQKITSKASVLRNSMNILEIEPVDSFTLPNSNSKSGTDSTQITSNNTNITVNVTRMTMPEYISNIEQVNGKYDVVVIGNKSDAYTEPFTSKPTYLPYGKEVYNGLRDTNYNYIVGMLNDTAWVGKYGYNKTVSGANTSGKTYVEYYNENDITNKRASEILDCINSGQLVYIDESIFNHTRTKLYSNFYNLTKTNLIRFNQSSYDSNKQIDLGKIVGSYMNNNSKAPVLTISSMPAIQHTSRDMSFSYSLNTDSDQSNMQVNLYVDLNGDGLFKGKELVATDKISSTNSRSFNGNIRYTIDNQFVGTLNWKLEVVTSGKVKVYKIGKCQFDLGTADKPRVRVLQVNPDSGNNLNLSNNSAIATLITGVNDYNITIEQMTATNFETYLANSSNLLNGKYDMIILGFADNYGHVDFNRSTTYTRLIDFIKTGQSVMFTHDTLTYRYLNPIDVSDKNSKNITYKFRDIIGQARYKDIENNPTEDIYARIDDPNNTISNRATIPHDYLKDTDANKISLGLTKGILDQFNGSRVTYNRNTYDNANLTNAGSYKSGTESKSVHKINDGLINEYPYILNDKSNLSVAPTHYQWYQLNLEDPDVVPWYTLNDSGGGYNPYDARNYYYTYSKGNITYSGTGHTNGYTDEEYKLFINTMVKAERGANHAPTFTLSNLDNGEIISRNQDNLRFTLLPKDRDNDDINYKITIKSGSTILVTKSDTVKQGQPIPISFTKDQYSKSGINNITIVVEVSDTQGAAAPTDTRSVVLSDDPTISLSSSNDNNSGYLIGDTSTVTVTANANRSSSNINTVFTNINYDITGGYNDSVSVVSGGNKVNFDNVTFNPDPNVPTQNKEYKFSVKREGNLEIGGTLSYIQKDRTVPVTSPYKIILPVRSGNANISILNKDKEIVATNAVLKYKKNNTNDDWTVVNLNSSANSDGNNNLSGLTTGDYTFQLTGLPSGYELAKGESDTKTFSFDYNNYHRDISFSVKPVQDLSHGLYYDGSIHDSSLSLVKGSNATFGASFTINDPNPTININLDDNIKVFDATRFKVYKVTNNGPTEVTNYTINNISTNLDRNNYSIRFTNNDVASNYIVTYPIKIEDRPSYVNTATLNDTTRTVNITTEELKDLF